MVTNPSGEPGAPAAAAPPLPSGPPVRVPLRLRCWARAAALGSRRVSGTAPFAAARGAGLLAVAGALVTAAAVTAMPPDTRATRGTG